VSTTYLEVVNEVLSELNEVLLTASTFSNARNIQRHVKEAVNRAYFDINNPEHKWPWLASAVSIGDFYGNQSIETVNGTRWYLFNPSAVDINDDYGHIDWEHVEITTAGVVGETAPYQHEVLNYIELDEWKDHFANSEDRDESNTSIGGMPRRIFKNPDGRRFGLSPIPDKVYKIYFFAWDRPEKLNLHSDTFNLPDQFIHVLIARARYYAWQRKEQPDDANLALQEYKASIRGMRQQTIDATPDAMNDTRIRFV